MSSILLKAFSEGDEAKCLKIIREQQVDLGFREKCFERTWLHLAAEAGFNEVILSLLKKGLDIDAVMCDKGTPLHDASANGHKDTVKLLVERGADPLARDESGWTAMHWAIHSVLPMIVKALISCFTVNNQRKKLLEILNAKNDTGATPLHFSATSDEEENLKISRLLIKAGAQVDARDKDGDTPLLVAVRKDSGLQARFLIGCNADLRLKNQQGEDALKIASKGKDKILKRDLEKIYLNKKQKKCLWTSEYIALSLQKLQQKLIKNNNVAQLIGERLSPTNLFFRKSPLKGDELETSGTYYRSDKHPRGKDGHLLYKNNKDLNNGKYAYVGGYGNVFQMLGDNFKPVKEKLQTSRGNSKLYDALLTYKKGICEYIIKNLELPQNASNLKVGYYNNYPCIMVCIDKKTIHKAQDTKNPSGPAFEEWVNFLVSYFIGLTNYNAYNRHLCIELERRSSFGFITPTVAPTGDSMRISVGLIPILYADILIDSLTTLNQVLNNLSTNKCPPLSKKVFYGSHEHKAYLGNKYPPVAIDNAVQLLWAQIEKGGKTAVQNIVRTSYARNGISAAVFNQLSKKDNNTHRDAFLAGIDWAISQLYINKSSLSFDQTDSFEYEREFTPRIKPLKDPGFWGLIEQVIKSMKKIDNSTLRKAISSLEYCCAAQTLDDLYYSIELCNELIFVNSIEAADESDCGDGYGSDSEGEFEQDIDEKNEVKSLFSKKLITHNGMRAIWCSIIAAAKHLNRARIFLDNSYYEVPLGLPLIRDLYSLPTITVVKKVSEANIILYDLNACITSGKQNGLLTIEKGKILILDCTSSTADCVKKYLPSFIGTRGASVMFLVDSGFKNQQIGGDKNQYGTVRIVTKDEKLRDKLYLDIKTFERPLLSTISHHLRRNLKKIGAVPTTKYFIQP